MKGTDIPNITCLNTTYNIDTYAIRTSSSVSLLVSLFGPNRCLSLFSPAPRALPWPSEREHEARLRFRLFTTLVILCLPELPLPLYLQPAGHHVASSRDRSGSRRTLVLILITTFSTTCQADGCKYYTCWLFYGVFLYVCPILSLTESTILFATRSANSFSMSMGYVDLENLAEGDFNRTFLITIVVARIPYQLRSPGTTRSLVK